MEEDTLLPQDEIEEALLLMYLRGKTSKAENSRITQWRKERPENERMLLQVAQIYYARQTAERIGRRDTLAALEKTLKRRRRKTRRLRARHIAIAAACLALVVSLAVNYRFLSQEEEAQPSFIVIRTNVGMRTELTLPDGTAVHLNASGKLTYPASFGGAKERRVTLEGEGYFRVARDAKRPFIVCAANGNVEVEALGTAFNLQTYASDSLLKTTLIEGSVRIGIPNASGSRTYATIKPSERAVYNLHENRMKITSVHPACDTAWIQGRLMFRETTVPEALTRLERFYGVTFEVRDPVINRYLFTGTFENRPLSQVLDYFCIASHIRYEIIPPAKDDSRSAQRTKVILKKI
jgi:ferric-dicitrate binding protein FerR (iron transport regulator)